MELLAKLSDAGSMFWQSLDEHERRLLLYFLCYLAATAALAAQRASCERLKRELREEILGGDRA